MISDLIRKTFQKIVFFISTKDINRLRTIKKIYYGNYFLIGQVNECLNLENLQGYKCEDRGVTMYRPKYDTVTGTFQGLYKTLGYIMVRGYLYNVSSATNTFFLMLKSGK